MSALRDPWGALVDPDVDPRPGAASGPLAGTTFVAKDLFAVAGTVTGAGQPTWAATHDPAPSDAEAVARLLAAGSTLVGKAHTAEMAYSLSGANAHHGMPVNPAAPGLDPGGSSSGSAAAVAGGAADLGLGTDTLGSIRVPASSCGLFGWRPTHGRVPDGGVHPLARSLDTVGLLARDPRLLVVAATVLVDTPLADPVGEGPPRLLVADDAFALLDGATRTALLDEVAALGPEGTIRLAPAERTLADLTLVVRDVQGPEFTAAHGRWIARYRPAFGPGVAERIDHALHVTPAEHDAATEARAALRAELMTRLGPRDVVLLPAGPPPPVRDATDDDRAAARTVAAGLSVVGSLAGLPTVVVPAVVVDGRPVGLALLGAPGADGLLLSLAAARAPVPPARRPGSA